MAGRLKWYALILLVIVAIPATVIPFVLSRSRPAFRSFDEMTPADIARLEVRLFNLKAIVPASAEGETVPDTVGPFEARPDDIGPLVALLQGAKELAEMPPGPWLGEYRLTLTSGRKQRVRVKFGGNPARPGEYKVWYRIGADQLVDDEKAPGFEATCSARAFVAAVAAAERKAVGR